MEKAGVMVFTLGCAFTVLLISLVVTALTKDLAQGKSPSNRIGDYAFAAEHTEIADKTLSPFFFVKNDDTSVDRLPLKSTSVKVDIAGMIADVRVSQVYKNEGKKPIEAIYIFPASTKAAVYGMTMIIGERTITARIQKREEARKNYEQAKQEGKSASLLEQQRPNVFQMNVANILPGDEVKTELQYTELLTQAEGIYEFVYPTVVGPRYSNRSVNDLPDSEKWVANPYLHEGESPTYSFDIVTRLAAGLPIQHMACASHKADIAYEDPSRATINLDQSEKAGGNRDYILRYRLAGDRVASGMLLYEGKDENFFLVMMQPPKRVTVNDIPPREYIFVVDVSGSMNGFPLGISKDLLKNLIGGLRPTDTFNVLLFSGGSQLMANQSVAATPENIRHAIDVIDHQQGGGGTEMLPALKQAFSLPANKETSRTVIIVTDGYVDAETEVFDLIRNQIGQANFFAFGIGSSVNRYLIEGMARAGAGEPFVIAKPEEASKQAERFRQYIQSPVLTHIKLDFDGFDAYDVEPARTPDIFAERPVVVFGKWRGQPRGQITLRGISGNRNYEERLDVTNIKPQTANSALRYLWSRSRLAELSDYNQLRPNDERISTITDLALKYNLLSAYTSFVAIDTEVRLKDGQATTVKQPLPLPQGVSDYAVGEGAPQPTALYRKSGLLGAANLSAAPPMHIAADGKREKEEPKRAADESTNSDKKPVVVKIGRITIAGHIPEAALRQALEQSLGEIQNCATTTTPGRSGEIVLKWTVDSGGKVKEVKLVSDGIRSKALKECLIQWIKKHSFPPSSNAGESTVTASILIGSR